jgi:hypothetical protein
MEAREPQKEPARCGHLRLDTAKALRLPLTAHEDFREVK